MSWLGLLAYAVPLMVVIQISLHKLNPYVQLHCVSGRPAAFYLDKASNSVVDFHQHLWWYDFLGQLPITTDSQKPHQGPLDEFLGGRQLMKHNPTVALYVFNGIEGNSELRKTRRGSSRTTLTLLFLDWCSYPVDCLTRILLL